MKISRIIWVYLPELRNTFEIVAATVWLMAGIGLAVGFFVANVTPDIAPNAMPLRDAA
jgi:hypothetical protein